MHIFSSIFLLKIISKLLQILKHSDMSVYSSCFYYFLTLGMFDMSRETDVSVTLYSRKVMILAKANNILPRWLRFVRGREHVFTLFFLISFCACFAHMAHSTIECYHAHSNIHHFYMQIFI